MEIRQYGPSAPGTSPAAGPPPRRGRRWPLGVLAVALAGGAAAGAVLATVPDEPARRAVPPPPAAGPRTHPQALALAALTSGVPAALPDLTALMGERVGRGRGRAHGPPGGGGGWGGV
ncbi:hypothetical protein ACWDZX_38260, partial [Streptomyces collinus]